MISFERESLMRRSLLFSCALHGAFVLVVLVTAPRRATRESVNAVEIAVEDATPASPAVAIDVAPPAHTGGGGPAHPTEMAVVEPVRARHRRPLATRATTTETAPTAEAAPGLAAPPTTQDGQVVVPQGAPAPGSAGATGDPAAGTGDGAGAGNGLGDGSGDGFGDGAGGTAMSR
jgi:hypothetical protein